jgi:AAA domain
MSNQLSTQYAYGQPRLHPNLILSSLQLLAWILFLPSAWRDYIARVDPTLPPDCTLLDISPAYSAYPRARRILAGQAETTPPDAARSDSGRTYWRHPLMWRILASYLVYIPIILGVSMLVLWLFGRTGDTFIIGIIAPILIAIFYLILGGIWISVAVGLVLSVPGSLIFALGYGIRGGLGYPMTSTLPGALVYGVVIGLAGGLAGHVAINITRKPLNYSLSRWSVLISGALNGILLGGAAMFAMLSVLRYVIYAIFDVLPPGGNAQSLGLAVALLLILSLIFATIVKWRHARRVLLINLLTFVVLLAMFVVMRVFNFFPGTSIALPILFIALIGLPYGLVVRIAGPRIAAAAAALGLGVGWNAWIITAYRSPPWLFFLSTIACIVAGLTLPLWVPVVFHPLFELWNMLLLRLEKQRPANVPSLLRWHSAFWHEAHYLPFHSLEDHLVWVAEHKPDEARAATAFLSNTNYQQWAARAAQIELYARRLESCTDIQAIADAAQNLAAINPESPISTLLRSFSRISQTTRAALNSITAFHKRVLLRHVENDLDTLLQGMTLSSEQHIVRFRPIAARWRQLVIDYIREVTIAAEHSQEVDNPYIFSVPLAEYNDLFVGRVEVAARIEQLILDTRRPPLLLYGQRRMGKTSLLHNLGRFLPSSTVLLFVDGEGIAGASDFPDLLYAIASAMAKSADQHRHLIVPLPSRAALESSPFGAFNEWLDQVEGCLDAERRSTALLALDEFEALESLPGKSRFDQVDLLRLLRHLIQHRPRFKVLLAGSHTLDEFRQWAGYLINMQVIKVSYLDEKDALDLIERPVRGFNLRYDPQASRRIIELTRCHPHLIQMLCFEIVELKNRQTPEKRRIVTFDDVETATQHAIATGDLFFSDLSNQAGEGGPAVLRFIAASGEGALIDRAAIERQFPDALDDILPLLLRCDLIELAPGGYRFQVELVRRWFTQTGVLSVEC